MDVASAGLTTVPGLEVDNAGRISLADVQNNTGLYVAVVYDAKAAVSGSKGDADVVATCNGLACSASEFVVQEEPANYVSGSPISLGWVPCCEDGFVVGPILSGDQACFTHSALFGVTSAIFVDGTDTDHFIGSEIAGVIAEICVGFS